MDHHVGGFGRKRGVGGDVHDASAPALDHPLSDDLGAVHDAPDIQRNFPFGFVARFLEEGPWVRDPARIVDEDVHRTHFALCLLGQLLHRVAVGHVGRDYADLPRKLRSRVSDLACLLPVSGRDDDLSAFRGESEHQPAADPPAAAGDDHRLVLQAEIHRILLTRRTQWYQGSPRSGNSAGPTLHRRGRLPGEACCGPARRKGRDRHWGREGPRARDGTALCP